MGAMDYGYYRSDGLQNSGTALRYGNGNAYIYNSAGQIYPRQITENFYIGVPNGGYLCQTVRSGYTGTNEKAAWRTDKAYQGYFQGREGRSRQACGFFFAADSRKISVGGGNIINFQVNHVKIEMNRTAGGYQSRTLNGVLRQGNLINSFKNGVFRGQMYSDVRLNDQIYNFRWLPLGQTTVLEDRGGNLCTFIQNFLRDGSVNSLCIHNNEDRNGSSGQWSDNYGSATNFTMIVEGTKTVQL